MSNKPVGKNDKLSEEEIALELTKIWADIRMWVSREEVLNIYHYFLKENKNE